MQRIAIVSEHASPLAQLGGAGVRMYTSPTWRARWHARATVWMCSRVNLYDADPARIRMVPCGHDPQELAPMDMRAARRVLGWEPDTFYLLQLGRMVPRKGIDNVIRALARLRRSYGVNARLCVVGGDLVGGTDIDELQRLVRVAEEERVADYVEFTGSRARDVLSRYYSAADVFVTTPWYEPFGITPIEAMACQRPVVGSATGGIKYSVVDGKTPKDADALAGRLATLAGNRMLAQQMGRAGALRARNLFTWSKVGDELAAIFRDLAAQKLPAWQVAAPGAASVLNG